MDMDRIVNLTIIYMICLVIAKAVYIGWWKGEWQRAAGDGLADAGTIVFFMIFLMVMA